VFDMSNDRQFHNLTALVTGASSGIGEATAIALAQHGPVSSSTTTPSWRRPKLFSRRFRRSVCMQNWCRLT
jgi:hypothetical protein